MEKIATEKRTLPEKRYWKKKDTRDILTTYSLGGRQPFVL
jgi:hypothetical protein